LGRLARFAQWLPGRRGTWRVVDRVASGADVPERLPPRGAVVVRAIDVDRFLALDCPCSDHHRLLLDLDTAHYPTWTVRDGNPLTVWPSVDHRRNEGRCHFVIRRGQVRWVPNDE
jgi:hypothetical protein